MSWLFGQTWLWYLIAFLVGVLLAWLLLVLPRQRKLTALTAAGPRTGTKPGAAAAATPTTPTKVTDDAPTERHPVVSATDSASGTTAGLAAAGSATPAAEDTAAEDTAAAAPGAAAPHGPGSASPNADGSAPGPEFTIKGNADSMLYHTTESPYYGRTKAEVWFSSVAAAAAAGFSRWSAGGDESPQDTANDEPTDTPSDGTGTAPQGLASAATPLAPAAGAAAASASAPTTPSFTRGPYPGSVLPNNDGSAPSSEFTIKGNADSMLYHTTESPYYGRTVAEAWFRTAEDAEAAGFRSWRTRSR